MRSRAGPHLSKKAAHQYRLLVAAALIKLVRQGRLDEVPDGPIDPYRYLTEDERRSVVKGDGGRSGR